MSDNINKFYFVEPKTSKASEEKPKKRKPNMFILFRNEMMNYKPINMQMTEYSKLVSKWWKELPIDDKTELQRRYQINRDQRSQNTVSECATVDPYIRFDAANGENLERQEVAIFPSPYPKIMKNDFYLPSMPQ
ncbi:5195_t:CDS:1 [Funneliformis geosporum]|uniref:18686_t:CDS:1 n=1 Tax=Funneliformis geosporum TaxID=1117311 RepID=A0A9W4SGX5_9GLOM|nr:5195_t:CDS:1 [Funneliformis geosporum]CAI2169157.1 18686_t:CDS:1 [Funneliformis geosporum]